MLATRVFSTKLSLSKEYSYHLKKTVFLTPFSILNDNLYHRIGITKILQMLPSWHFISILKKKQFHCMEAYEELSLV